MTNPEQSDKATAHADRWRVLRWSGLIGSGAVITTLEIYALTMGAIDDVHAVVKEGGAQAAEVSVQGRHAAWLAGGTALDVTCQLSATEVIGTDDHETTYAIDPALLAPIENPVQPTTEWVAGLHDCSQPIQYNTRTP